MNLSYQKTLKNGATVSVCAWLTFEGKKIMPLQEFHDYRKTSLTHSFLVRMDIDFQIEPDVKYIGKVSDNKVSAYREQWMNFDQYLELLAEFEKHGPNTIHTFSLTRK
jgi:hypothetical protein